jgi:NADH dehydrogenase
VIGIDEQTVNVEDGNGGTERIPVRTVVWAVTASTLAADLAVAAGAELDRAGRLIVESNLTLPGHPEVLVIGDMVAVRVPDGEVRPLPGLAPVAMGPLRCRPGARAPARPGGGPVPLPR